MRWNFPLINPDEVKTIKHYADHVREELDEFEQEPDGSLEKAMELLDTLHSVESLVRKYFERNSAHNPDELVTQIIQKNRARGYYGKELF